MKIFLIQTSYVGLIHEGYPTVIREKSSLGLKFRSNLNPRLDLRNVTRNFAWGTYGNGAVQLALAILADSLMDDDSALKFHRAYAFLVIAEITEETWVIKLDQVSSAMEDIKSRDPAFTEGVEPYGFDEQLSAFKEECCSEIEMSSFSPK